MYQVNKQEMAGEKRMGANETLEQMAICFALIGEEKTHS